jgi:hypothetical protein
LLKIYLWRFGDGASAALLPAALSCPDGRLQRMGKLSAAVSGEDEVARGRRESLATVAQRMTDDGAFQRLVQENAPEVELCRQILRKKPGKRSLDDVHVVRTLLLQKWRCVHVTDRGRTCAMLAQVAVRKLQAARVLLQPGRMYVDRCRCCVT